MKALLFTCSLLFTLISYGQYDIDDIKRDSTDSGSKFDWEQQKEKFYVGGEFNFAFRPGATFLYISPLIGYDITKRFSAGVSTIYQLQRFRQVNATYNFNTFGMGVFARYRPIEQVILQTEYNVYNTVDLTISPYDQRIIVPAFLAGLGYANSLGDRSYYQMILMYDFIGNPHMPVSPIIIPRLHLKLGLVWYLG